jgi:FkbM family methyltransferase
MKKFIKNMFGFIGLEVKRKNLDEDPLVQLCRGLKKAGVTCVFDIGANTGQFATDLRRCGYDGKIISFEPLPTEHSILMDKSKYDPLWIVHERVAIGAKREKAQINISRNSVSSSLLPMLESHKSSAPKSEYIENSEVDVIDLDSVMIKYIKQDDLCFIKIDTQGYESFVIEGAKELIKRAKGIMCELSLIPLYEGQALWVEIIDRLRIDGFMLWSYHPGFYDSKTGRTLQVDAIFYRMD